MLIDLSKYLIHIGQVQTTQQDGDANYIITSITTINCLFYTGDFNRVLSGRGNQQSGTFADNVLVYPNTVVKEGDSIVNIIDPTACNRVLVASCRVKKLDQYNHWGRGPSLLALVVDVN